MSRFPALALSALLMLGAPALADEQHHQAQAGRTIELVPDAVEFSLSNGMRVVVSPDRRAPVVTHMIWYQVGAADELPGESGVAHFLEHLMFKGTSAHPGAAFDQAVARIGGDQNAFTDFDYTAYFQRIPREKLREMMELEADRMRNLVLTEAIAATERDVVLNERREVIEESPEELLHEALMRILYLNHPYGRPVIGWMHEIRELDRDTAVNFYRRYYASNAVLVVAGDTAPQEVRRLAEQTYGRVAAREEIGRRSRPAEPPPVGPRTVTIRHVNVHQPLLERAYVVASFGSAETREVAAVTVLAQILGGGSTSRFYDDLVRNGGLAAEIGAEHEAYGLDHGRLVIIARPKPGTELHELEARMDGVIEGVHRDGVSQADLERAKRAAIAKLIYALDDQEELATKLGEMLMAGKTVADFQNWPAAIRAVTAPEVKSAAERYLRPEAAATGYLKPDK